MPEWSISAEELHQAIKNGEKLVLVDVREPEEHAEARIEGCKLIPLDELSSRAKDELSLDDDIVLYCAHGVRSLHGVMALRMLGFDKLRSLDGGIEAWFQAQR